MIEEVEILETGYVMPVGPQGPQGRGVQNMELKDNNLIVGYSDGTEQNIGEISPNEKAFNVDPVFANNSWETIAEVARYGDPSRYWKVGDYKEIEIAGQRIPVQIIGFNHDTVSNKSAYGKGKAGLTLMLGCTRTRYDNKVGVFTGNIPKLSVSSSDNHIVSPNRVAGDGTLTEEGSNWVEGAFRHYLAQFLNSKLPKEIKDNIVTVNKVTSYAFNAKNYYRNMAETQDKYFLLSEYEMYGEQLCTKANEGEQYEFFKLGYSKAVITPELYNAQQNGTTGYTNSRLWLRSVASKYVDPYIPSTDYYNPLTGYTSNPSYTGDYSPYTNSLTMSYNGGTGMYNYYTGSAKNNGSISAYITPCFCL